MEAKSVIQFKASKKNTSWEDTPAFHTGDYTDAEANKLAKRLAKALRTTIRWNHAGVFQGHYILPEDK